MPRVFQKSVAYGGAPKWIKWFEKLLRSSLATSFLHSLVSFGLGRCLEWRALGMRKRLGKRKGWRSEKFAAHLEKPSECLFCICWALPWSHVHPKLANIQHGNDPNNPLNTVTDADRIAVIKAFLAENPDILKQVYWASAIGRVAAAATRPVIVGKSSYGKWQACALITQGRVNQERASRALLELAREKTGALRWPPSCRARV
jgi:hypothetical protein